MAEGGALLRRYVGELLRRGFESLLLRLDSSDGSYPTRRWGNLPVRACGATSSPRTKAGSFAPAFVLGFEVPPDPLHRSAARTGAVRRFESLRLR